MKTALKYSVATAVASAALFASTAFAQTIPPPTTNPSGSGLIVSIWDTTKDVSLTSYLGLNFVDVLSAGYTAAEGKLVDFGTLAGFSSTFAGSSSANLVYTVFAARGFGGATNQSILTTGPLGGELGTGGIPNNGNVNSIISAANGYYGAVNTACTSVPCVSDATLATPLNTAAFAGQDSWGDTYNGGLTQASGAGAVGTALGFYQVTKTSNTAGNAATVVIFQNATALGQWLLTNAGGLTYSIAGVSEVPLPAAIWLLMSGCAGLVTIGRRKAEIAA